MANSFYILYTLDILHQFGHSWQSTLAYMHHLLPLLHGLLWWLDVDLTARSRWAVIWSIWAWNWRFSEGLEPRVSKRKQAVSVTVTEQTRYFGGDSFHEINATLSMYSAYMNSMSLYQMKHNFKPTGTYISKVVSPNWGTETSTWKKKQKLTFQWNIHHLKMYFNLNIDIFHWDSEFSGEVPKFLQPDPSV